METTTKNSLIFHRRARQELDWVALEHFAGDAEELGFAERSRSTPSMVAP